MKTKIRRKIKLDIRIKIGLMAVIGCFIIFLGIRIYGEVTANKVIKEEEPLYQYSCQPKVEYIVHIHENSIFEGTVQGEGIDYSKLLLDYIEVKFGTEFQGSKEAEVEFDYQISAQVTGYRILMDSKSTNWSKNFPLEKEKKMVTSDAYFNEETIIKFDLEDFEAFATEAGTVTGMQSSSEVVINMVGNINIKTENGNLSTPISAALTIPLQQDVFSISKGDIAPINDSITNFIEVPVPINHKNILLFSILIAIGLLGMLLILFATEAPNSYDILKAKAKKLIKNYGSHMIALLNKTEHDYLQTYELNSMEDLIKVADEIQRPIYYLRDEIDIIQDYMLHVVDGDNLYTYRFD